MPATSPPKRACDQCHAVKEKCRRISDSAPCERCSRLGQECQTIRSPAKTGRKPRAAEKISYSLPVAQSSNCSGTSLQLSKAILANSPTPYNAGLSSNQTIFADLDEWEKHFLNFMKDVLAPSPLDKFLVGPSFHEAHHTSFVQNLIQPIPELRNASVACAAVLFSDRFAEHTNKTMDIGHKRAALAVSSLRCFQISNEKDLTTMLILSVAMITFAMHVTDGQPYLIAQYTLSIIKSQYQSLINFQSPMMDLFMCLVSTETFECLLRSKTPAWRLDTSQRGNVIDRYLGLSYPLFPLFFDICEAADQLRNCKINQRDGIFVRLMETKAAVDQWYPSPEADFLVRLSRDEVVTIMTQARILRLAGLLIIHRLRYPFGQHDDEAQRLSRDMISEFNTVLRITERSVPCTSLAYLAACFEAFGDDRRKTALAQIPSVITFSKQAQIKTARLLKSMWDLRDCQTQFYWFELGEYF
ncbi:hypothetical protein N7478_004211 [Penicillium angulare]|uniref:uncharacterized protein n=1 Tax=Penicillium angulare TaxID=116970 RepID=UPI00254172CE|nr:uncharacterized protein N7478_004211 [Penicillium angulare]KAJ5278839.1 hypothetical protein N7478_004211 [Penicillium angulare]